MPESTARTVFYPYLYGDQAITVRMESCVIDGRSVPEVWREDLMECGLPDEHWIQAILRFVIEAPIESEWVSDYVPEAERKDPPVELIARLHCGRTFTRTKFRGELNFAERKGIVSMVLNREKLQDRAEVDFFLVRTIRQTIDSHYASDSAARLMGSPTVTIRFGRSAQRLGSGLDTEWESFTTSLHTYRKNHSGALFHLDLIPSPPKLYLNNDADPDLRAILKDEAPRGKKASVRNIAFAAIAVPVWYCLLQAAVSDADDDGDFKPGWKKNVLACVAAVSEPDCEPTEALRRLVKKLLDPAKPRPIDEELPVILADLVKFREKLESVAGVVL